MRKPDWRDVGGFLLATTFFSLALIKLWSSGQNALGNGVVTAILLIAWADYVGHALFRWRKIYDRLTGAFASTPKRRR